MKVTVKFDEAASMTPEQVRVQQSKVESDRKVRRMFADCQAERVTRVSSGFNGLNLGDVLAKGGAR